MTGRPEDDADEVAAAILTMAEVRRAASFCPSEVARALAGDWRPLMPVVRAAAARLADEGRIVVTQKGVAVDARTARGAIRLRGAGVLD